MKFKTGLAVAAVAAVLSLGGYHGTSIPEAPSFRQQMLELVQLRDAGLISDHKYRARKLQILRVMMH